MYIRGLLQTPWVDLDNLETPYVNVENQRSNNLQFLVKYM